MLLTWVDGIDRRFIEEEQLDEELVKHLPREEGKPVEKPAEAALRTKMYAPDNSSARGGDCWFYFLAVSFSFLLLASLAHPPYPAL